MLLTVSGLHKSFGGLHAVDDVTFTVTPQIIKSVIGPNGAGKTTLFNLITGVLYPQSGRVEFNHTDITSSKPHQIAAKGIFRTFQNLKLSSHLTVLENVKLGRHVWGKTGFLQAMLRLPITWREEEETEEAAFDALHFVSMQDFAYEIVSNLPFGKQRAVELARALAAQPELLLLDEPASGLNIQETEELASLITSIKERGITILLVEHDMSLVMDISDEIMVLNFGRKLAEGTPREIQKNREVISVYLGETDA
jgi:branched-chain amino acid transport system ATP-binding protein